MAEGKEVGQGVMDLLRILSHCELCLDNHGFIWLRVETTNELAFLGVLA